MKRNGRLSWTCFVALGLLSACTHTQIREVKIPIPVPCVTSLPDKPASALDSLSLEVTLFEAVQALLVDRERMGAYALSLEGVLEACR